MVRTAAQGRRKDRPGKRGEKMTQNELSETAIRLREMRKRKGLTQKDLADRYGIPKRTVENWETGSVQHRECPLYVLDMLERLLDIDYEDKKG
jgi:DNA-binding transcriptional regulator YiaG